MAEAEEWICELEDRKFEITYSEKNWKKMYGILSKLPIYEFWSSK